MRSRVKLREVDHQIALFEWAAWNERRWPVLKWMHSIPNGAGKLNVTTRMRLKRSGLKRGICDICLPVARRGYHGLYLEMKILGNYPSPEQKEFITFLKVQGYQVILAYHWEEAKDAITEYLSDITAV